MSPPYPLPRHDPPPVMMPSRQDPHRSRRHAFAQLDELHHSLDRIRLCAPEGLLEGESRYLVDVDKLRLWFQSTRARARRLSTPLELGDVEPRVLLLAWRLWVGSLVLCIQKALGDGDLNTADKVSARLHHWVTLIVLDRELLAQILDQLARFTRAKRCLNLPAPEPPLPPPSTPRPVSVLADLLSPDEATVAHVLFGPELLSQPDRLRALATAPDARLAMLIYEGELPLDCSVRELRELLEKLLAASG